MDTGGRAPRPIGTWETLTALGAQGAVVAVLVTVGAVRIATPSAPRSLAAVAAAAAAAAAVPWRVDLRPGRPRADLVAAALVIGLLVVGPVNLVLVVPLGVGLATVLTARSLRCGLIRTVATALPVAVGCIVFSAAGGVRGAPMRSWPAALAAGVVFALFARVSREVTEEPVADVNRSIVAASVFAGGLGAVCAATVVAGTVIVGAQGWMAVALLAPAVASMIAGAHVLAGQRDARRRFERLASASSRTIGLQSFDAALRQAAGEARILLDGASAVCMASTRDGEWAGVIVGPDDEIVAPPELCRAVAEWVGAGRTDERAGGELRAVTGYLLPEAASVVTATDATGCFAIMVLRGSEPEAAGSARAELLAAFVSQAALISTNALLFQQAEDALRQQVDMNRQKDEFLAAVSHELRTPLASMIGSVDTLRRLDGRMTEDARERFFTIAQRQGKRLQRLIEELLLTASLDHRQELVVGAPCRLDEILEEVAVDLSSQAEGRITVRCSPGAEVISTDPNKLRQVLTNLVENATKYAGEGPIEVSAREVADRIEVRVVDHGPGIAPEDRSRAFERFVQLDGSSTRSQGGTGLGLYLCKRVAELLEADLRLAETPGGGATFVVSLPRAHSSALHLPQSGPVGSAGFAVSPLRSGPASGSGPKGSGPKGSGPKGSGPKGSGLDRSLLDLTRGPSSGPAAGLGARPVVPAGLRRRPQAD
ncbi:MAG: hypothetical protein NVSMB16_01330 [Acidimicrobiales bacterium]